MANTQNTFNINTGRENQDTNYGMVIVDGEMLYEYVSSVPYGESKRGKVIGYIRPAYEELQAAYFELEADFKKTADLLEERTNLLIEHGLYTPPKTQEEVVSDLTNIITQQNNTIEELKNSQNHMMQEFMKQIDAMKKELKNGNKPGGQGKGSKGDGQDMGTKDTGDPIETA